MPRDETGLIWLYDETRMLINQRRNRMKLLIDESGGGVSSWGQFRRG
ncbi:hypothetical protein Hanom_Chr16g01441931 [Helianthus anomalus]